MRDARLPSQSLAAGRHAASRRVELALNGLARFQGLPLIGPTRRHVHQTRNAEAAWKGSVDCRLDDVRSEEGEGKSHAGRSFTNAFAGGDRLRAIAAPWRWRIGVSFSLQPGSASPRWPIRSNGWITSRLRRKA